MPSKQDLAPQTSLKGVQDVSAKFVHDIADHLRNPRIIGGDNRAHLQVKWRGGGHHNLPIEKSRAVPGFD